jgi:SAM-dependent methyltransferase
MVSRMSYDLGYFTEWGGKSWVNLVEQSLSYMGDIQGKRVLDIGCRYGKISALLSLMGADVTGVDIHKEHIEIAEQEARKWGVNPRFILYEGSLDIFPDNHFDIIFTKSVLVVIPELNLFLQKINQKLKPGGMIVFIENSKGGLLHYLRKIKHRNWNYDYVNFFTNDTINTIKSFFNVTIRKKIFPPIYLITGKGKC